MDPHFLPSFNSCHCIWRHNVRSAAADCEEEEQATFTIPKEPVRHLLHGIETFNVLRGGEYLFMPSLSALMWLAREEM
jgi:hypothetical protein